MTANTLEERKKNISEIKASFQNPHQSSRYQDLSGTDTDTAAVTYGGMFKMRLLIAVALFGAFVYCDKNDVKVISYTTKEVSKQVQKDLAVDKIMNKIEEALSFRIE